MKKALVSCVLLLFAVSIFTGCAAQAMSPYTPVTGLWYTEVQGPYAVTSNVTQSPKMGSGTVESYLGLVARGDISIDTIAKEAGITEIHYVDYETMSILGLYAEVTVKVYGE